MDAASSTPACSLPAPASSSSPSSFPGASSPAFVLNSASSWPEPMAVLLMIWLSFLSAVVCYREYLHIGVGLLPASLTGTRTVVRSAGCIEICMLVTNLFMLWWGIKLVQTTWYQSIAEFPIVSVGVSYLPVPHRRRAHRPVRDRAAVDAEVLPGARRPRPSSTVATRIVTAADRDPWTSSSSSAASPSSA